MAQEREKFVDGCERTGYGRAIGTALFDIIEPFADYAFGKSHAFGYGLVAYWTAWLKANHPVEYMACLLTSVKDDKDKMAVYLSECRSMGIEVLVPTSTSASDFTAVRAGGPGQGERRGVGQGQGSTGRDPLRPLRHPQRGGGPGRTHCRRAGRKRAVPGLLRLLPRVDPVVLNKRTVESLAKAGAFDSLGHPRQGLCLVLEQVVDRTLARRREADQGVLSLFGESGAGEIFDDTRVPIPENEFDKHTKLSFEKEMLGLYVSDHPLVGTKPLCGVTPIARSSTCGRRARAGRRPLATMALVEVLRQRWPWAGGHGREAMGREAMGRRMERRPLGGRRRHRPGRSTPSGAS